MSTKNVKTQEDETMDASQVYTMFEEVKLLLTKLTAQQEQTKQAPAPETSPTLDPEDGEKIETLSTKLDTVSEKLDFPLKHHHTLDFMSNWMLIVLLVVSTGLLFSLWVIRNQRDFRDNDLKYRYIQMRGEATPADIERLRDVFDWNHNPDSIRTIRRRVEQYERLVQEQAENEARAKLNDQQAKQLRQKVEQIRKK